MRRFIAEIGFNHMGNENLGIRLIKDISKGRPWGITVHIAEESYYDNKKPWRKKLNYNFYKKAKNFLKKKKIKFGIGIYDVNALKFIKKVDIDFWKVISTKFYNNNLIYELLKTKKPIYLSTGFAPMNDIKKKSKLFKKVEFVHTALDKSISQNLYAIKTIKKTTKRSHIAYGLHSNDDNVLIMALALDANPLFFYVRPNKKKDYPDNDHAIAVKDIKNKIRYWKNCVEFLGDGRKKKLKIPRWVLE